MNTACSTFGKYFATLSERVCLATPIFSLGRLFGPSLEIDEKSLAWLWFQTTNKACILHLSSAVLPLLPALTSLPMWRTGLERIAWSEELQVPELLLLLRNHSSLPEMHTLLYLRLYHGKRCRSCFQGRIFRL